MAFLGTFADDEPIEEVLEAAALPPEVNFYVTGDTAKADKQTLEQAAPNVTFTGFLDPNGVISTASRGRRRRGAHDP